MCCAASAPCWGRTRLMRLSGQAEVSPHIDQAYYWAERMRVHVPIVTQPRVTFYCGDSTLQHGRRRMLDLRHLASAPRATIDGDNVRIHLSPTPSAANASGKYGLSRPASCRQERLDRCAMSRRGPGRRCAELQFETVNVPRVMTPWELDSHLSFPVRRTAAESGCQRGFRRVAANSCATGRRLGRATATRRKASPTIAACSIATSARCSAFRGESVLRNGLPFLKTARMHGAERRGRRRQSGARRRRAAAGDAGSAIRTRTTRCSNSTGRSSSCRRRARDRRCFLKRWRKRRASTRSAAKAIASSRACRACIRKHTATHPIDSMQRRPRPTSAQSLHARFGARLLDRDGKPPPSKTVRMLEKTPKNSLRIPFLRAVFPQARFIYLYRDVRQTLASMIEAWKSGQFRMYPQSAGLDHAAVVAAADGRLARSDRQTAARDRRRAMAIRDATGCWTICRRSRSKPLRRALRRAARRPRRAKSHGCALRWISPGTVRCKAHCRSRATRCRRPIRRSGGGIRPRSNRCFRPSRATVERASAFAAR